jgi:fructose-1,6-bisphosphatase/inositol monophosphatase family enzyme
MDGFELAGRLKRLLLEAKDFLATLSDGGKVVRHGTSFGDVSNDTELSADRQLGAFLIRGLQTIGPIHNITVEGMGDYPSHGGIYRAYVDPLDGSLNYKMRGRGLGLPYTGCITALGSGSTFKSVAAAAICDYRSGDSWRVHKNGTGYHTSMNGRPALTQVETVLDLGSQIVIGEMYYPENRERLCRAFAGKKGWLRSPGSAAYEMALVASGTAAAFICDRQKQHELGAGYALVKGAGGVAVDFDGNGLGLRTYDFKTQTPVVLAANRPIADAVLALLHRS